MTRTQAEESVDVADTALLTVLGRDRNRADEVDGRIDLDDRSHLLFAHSLPPNVILCNSIATKIALYGYIVTKKSLFCNRASVFCLFQKQELLCIISKEPMA